MIEQAKESVLLLDASKLSARGRQAVAPIGSVSLVIADGLSKADAEQLRAAGATVRVIGEADASRGVQALTLGIFPGANGIDPT